MRVTDITICCLLQEHSHSQMHNTATAYCAYGAYNAHQIFMCSYIRTMHLHTTRVTVRPHALSHIMI